MLARPNVAVAFAFALLVGALTFSLSDGHTKDGEEFAIATDREGNIKLPKVDYRKDWVFLGSWSVSEDEGKPGAQGIHAVYTQLETVEAYRRTGKFPDGAVLIKELYSTKTEDMTTGTISRAEATSGWFVMIKDTQGRFPQNKLWGDGWGWAYFDAKDPLKTKTTDYKADCLGCHIPAKSQDWIYTQGYPVLRK